MLVGSIDVRGIDLNASSGAGSEAFPHGSDEMTHSKKRHVFSRDDVNVDAGDDPGESFSRFNQGENSPDAFVVWPRVTVFDFQVALEQRTESSDEAYWVLVRKRGENSKLFSEFCFVSEG